MKTVNTFLKGMDKDTSDLYIDSQRYRHLENGDIYYSEEEGFGEIVDVKGNRELDIIWATDTASYASIAGYPDVTVADPRNPYDSGYLIRGVGYIRDDIVLFYSNQNGNLIVDVLKYNSSNNNYVRINIIFNKYHNTSIDKKFVIETYYERQDIIKVYFSEKSINNKDLENLKYINVGVDSNDSGYIDVYLQGNYTRYKNVVSDNLEMLGRISTYELHRPILVDIKVGNLRNGTYQYFYRYINRYGNRTTYSDLSDTIVLVEGNYNNTKSIATSLTTGNSNEINSNHSIEMAFPVSSNFTHIEIFRIWYSDYHSVPSIYLISRVEMVGLNRVNIVDTNFDSVLSIVDSSVLNELPILFNAKSLAIKDSRLFAANIKEDTWDINFDARAYRFDLLGTCILEDASGNITHTIYSNDVNLNSTLLNIGEKEDVINPFNYVGRELEVNKYVYKPDGTLGAYGANIEIDFEEIILPVNTETERSLIHNIDFNVINNSIKEDYILGRKKLFRSDEVYRIGIVFRNEFGQWSPVKFICDLKMPSYFDIYGTNSDVDTEHYVKALIPKVTVKAEGTEAEGLVYKIVYVERGSSDVTVVAEGLATGVREILLGDPVYSELGTHAFLSSGTETAGAKVYSSYATRADVFFIETPEAIYNRNTDFNNCIIRLIGYYDVISDTPYDHYYDPMLHGAVYDSGAAIGDPKFKLYRAIDLHTISSNNKFDIEESIFKEYGKGVSIRDVSISKMAFFFDNQPCIGDSCSSNVVYAYGLNDFFRPLTGDQIPFVVIKKDTIPYGGYSYSNRLINDYIEASESTREPSILLTRGDTFYTMFEYIRTQVNIDYPYTNGNYDEAPYINKVSEVVYIPVQSSINTYLTSKDNFSKNITRTKLDTYENCVPTVKFMQNTEIGLGYAQTVRYFFYNNSLGTSDYAVTEGDDILLRPLREYNSVASKKSNYKTYVTDLDKLVNYKNKDTRIRYSQLKEPTEYVDSMLDFRIADYKDLNSKYGQINFISTFNDNLFSWQDSGFSYVLINPKVQVPTDDGSSMIIGTGRVLHDVKYLSTDIGIQNINEAIKSLSAIYWLDINKKKIYRYQSGIETLSDTKLVSSYLQPVINRNTEFIGVYDNSRKVVLMSILNYAGNEVIIDDFEITYSLNGSLIITGDTSLIQMKEGLNYAITDVNGITSEYTLDNITATTLEMTLVDGSDLSLGTIHLIDYVKSRTSFTIVFNEFLNSFIGFESFIPSMYLKGNKNIFTTNNDALLYEHNEGELRTFYGVQYPMIVDYVVNENPTINKEFGAIEVDCIALDTVREYEDEEDWTGVENITFDSVRVIGDRNMTEYIDIYPKDYRIETELDANGESTGNIDGTVYTGTNRVIHDTNGIRLIPYPTYLYNTRMTLNKFRLTLPRIRTGIIDNVNGGKEITELVRGNSATIRLIYNKNIGSHFKVNNIITYYNTSENK